MPGNNPYQPPPGVPPRFKFVPALPTWLGATCCGILSLAFAWGFAATLAEQVRSHDATVADLFIQAARLVNAVLLGGLTLALLKGYRRSARRLAAAFVIVVGCMLVTLIVSR